MSLARSRSRIAALILAAAIALGGSPALAQSPPPYVLSGPLLPLLLITPGNGWILASANLFSDVWTPPDLEPLVGSGTPPQSRLILAWSGFGWDSNRGDLILYGGGHANYSGNDVYRWHSSTLNWERASYPSEIVFDAVAGYQAIDGVNNAPSSAHTYDNNIFLPLADRFLTWGGAAYDNGGAYLRRLESDPTKTRPVGPYLFNPALADGNKVGGTTGSQVKRVAPHPEIVGGNMWANRDIHLNLAGQTMPDNHVNGCTGYAQEGGHDVVYVGATSGGSTNLELYRYQLTSIGSPTSDQISKVGGYAVGTAGTTTCGYDFNRKLFVRQGDNTTPFLFWDLTTPGPTNGDQRVTINSSISAFLSWLGSKSLNIQNCALEYDPNRHSFPLWCGYADVWELKAPATNVPSGWTITQLPLNTAAAPPGEPGGGTGVLGKWRYAPYYDVFVGLENINDGDVWIYKPAGWVQPNVTGNALPTVSITSPAAGLVVAPGTPVTLKATAGDTDGTIARVEWYVSGIKVGQATTSPYTSSVVPSALGSYPVIAVAVDNVGGMTASAPVTFTASTPTATVTLQDGLSGYAGESDTYLDGYNRTTAHGGSTSLLLDLNNYNPLLRFAIFASEGGPVPDGSIITSATLALYKQSYSETLALNALLVPWTETDATWTVRQGGIPWSVGGAAGAGTDYASTADASVAAGFNPGWVNFDVTARVAQWSASVPSNFGWRVKQTTTGSNYKQFNSSEFAGDVTLRPKLTITYATGAANVPPTVTLTSPAPGASITLGGSFSLAATAADSDGTVTKVEFFANGTSIGVDTATPYTLSWTPSAAASYTLTAVATDNRGASTTSNAVPVTVNSTSGGTTVTLQDGLTGYAGESDTYLDGYNRTTVRGGSTSLLLDLNNYTPLARFAIFASEGGPVPNGSTITSATLALYKQYYNDTIALNALLVPWNESEATWTVRQAGVPWSVGGAAGAGTDYVSAADASVAAPFNPGWISFDVTTRVQQWSGAAATNFGWRMKQTTTGTNYKQFDSSEFTTDVTLRPKLTITYTAGTGDIPPTVTLTSPAPGASITLGGSFSLAATAGDSDGSVAKVEFFANGTSIGVDTAAPYTLTWTPALAGAYTLTAVATDNLGVSTTSNAVNVTVNPAGSGTTVVLQDGLTGYAGESDTYLDAYLRTTVHGGSTSLLLDLTNYNPLLRFAIFASEGGPVPNGSTITSATLALYKQYYNDTIALNALLVPWNEAEATWTVRQAGVPWSAGGAAGVGTDYVSAADASVAAPFNPGWISFDVTTRVQQWAGASGTNFGWRVKQTTSGSNYKQFNSSEFLTDPTLRPKLTIIYR